MDISDVNPQQQLKKMRLGNLKNPDNLPEENKTPPKKSLITMTAPKPMQPITEPKAAPRTNENTTDFVSMSHSSQGYTSENAMELDENKGDNYAAYALNKYIADYFQSQETINSNCN